MVGMSVVVGLKVGKTGMAVLLPSLTGGTPAGGRKGSTVGVSVTLIGVGGGTF